MGLLGRASAAVAVLASTLLSFAAPAAAAETGEFSLRPIRSADAAPRDRSYVVRTVRPGQELTDRLEAVNLTDRPLELAIAAVDATILADGSFAPGTKAEADGRWLAVSPTRVRVPARGTSPVELRLRIPADASPGDHVAAVVAQRADGATTSGGGNVRLVQRVGVRTYLTVERPPGQPPARRAFELRDLRWVGAPAARTFEVDVANTGELLVEPLGTLTIARGGLSAATDVPVLGTVPVGESRTLRLSAPDPLEPGTYEATVRLRDVNGGAEQQRAASFTVGADTGPPPVAAVDGNDGNGSSRPWWAAGLALLALLALLAVAAAAVAGLRHRRRRATDVAG